MKKYIAYFRVSSKGQGESGLGLDGQDAIIDYFVKEPDEVVASFTDVMSGGSIKKRPQLISAIELCKKTGAILIVAKIDRLSRNIRDALWIFDQLGAGNIIFCDLPNTDEFTINLMFLVAERERLLGSIRTKAALAEAKKRGVILGRKKGYTHSQETKDKIRTSKLQNAVDVEPMILNMALKLRSEGQTYDKIATELNALGGTTSTGKKFHVEQVRRLILRNKKNENDG